MLGGIVILLTLLGCELWEIAVEVVVVAVAAIVTELAEGVFVVVCMTERWIIDGTEVD